MFIATFLAAVSLYTAPMTVSADIKDGAVIEDKRAIKVIVQSDSIVTQVEFYVDGDLRDTSTATPYTFTIDPLAEKDGKEKLTFTAYNTDGAKATMNVMVDVESGASRGPEVNTKTAQDLMVQGKWDDAMYAARLALKASPDYIPAQLVLAHVFLTTKVYDKAEEFAEDVLRSKPDMPEALMLVAAIQLERAFNVVSSQNQTANMNNMSDAIDSAIQARLKLVNADFDQLPNPSGADDIKYGRTAVETQHFSAAISALQSDFNISFATDKGNLIGYAQLRLGRFQDLQRTMQVMEAHKTLDGYSYALWAALAEYRGDKSGADYYIKEAILDKPDDFGVRTAQAYIALRRGNINTLTGITASLQSLTKTRPEVTYYLALLLHRLGRETDSDRAFQETVLQEPLCYNAYVARGNEAMLHMLAPKAKPEQVEFEAAFSRRMFQAALAAKPDSAEALTALATLELIRKKTADAHDHVDAAMAADPQYAAAFFAAASVYNTLAYDYMTQAAYVKSQAVNGVDNETQTKIDADNKTSQATRDKAFEVFAKAEKLDPPHLGGSQLPRIDDVFPYVYQFGNIPVISPPMP
jgi:Tfp pilus assembly protein PilF